MRAEPVAVVNGTISLIEATVSLGLQMGCSATRTT